MTGEERVEWAGCVCKMRQVGREMGRVSKNGGRGVGRVSKKEGEE